MTTLTQLREAAGHWQVVAWLQRLLSRGGPERAPSEHVGMYAGSLLPRDSWDHS